MRRKLRSETKTRFDRRSVGHLAELGRQAARFAIENVEALAGADPEGAGSPERPRARRLAAVAGDRRHGRPGMGQKRPGRLLWRCRKATTTMTTSRR